MKDFSEKISKLPDLPGVYIMRDVSGVVIYVGKAKNLKNRVSSYFRGFESHSPKTQMLVINLDEFEYIITDTESEALILENNLIKEYKPRFNIRLKDDKGYPYIKITNEKYPRVLKTRAVRKDGARYFGPYTSDYDVNMTIQVINEYFKLRKTNRDLSKKYNRPCLNYYIKKCYAPCMGYIDEVSYMQMIEEATLFLNGKQDSLIHSLSEKMQKYSQEQEYEKAVVCRDQIVAIKNLSIKQKISSDERVERDVISISSNLNRACIMVFFIRRGLMIGRESFIFEDVQDTQSEIINQFIPQFYGGNNNIPREIVLDKDIDDIDLYREWLSSKANRSVKIIVPQKGERKKLLDMLRLNTSDYLEKYFEKALIDKKTKKNRLIGISKLLGVDNVFERIEAYDISNILGTNSVGSMVVFENGEKKPSDYRRFKIKTVIGADDYSSMREIISRRFKRYLNQKNSKSTKSFESFDKFPDLLIIDGGKGHVEAVKDVLRELSVEVMTIGLLKDDRHTTDRVYYNGNIIEFDKRSDVFRFLAGIQDEVHRFAISYHRSLRDTQMISSELDSIKGIGKKRKQALLKYFGSVEKIRKAGLEDFQKVEGINKDVAKNIYDYWRTVDAGS